MTVKQTATDLTVESQGRNGAQTPTYKLDGTETDVTDGPDDRQGQREVGRRQARHHHQDRQGEQTQTWSLADGKLNIARHRRPRSDPRDLQEGHVVSSAQSRAAPQLEG